MSTRHSIRLPAKAFSVSYREVIRFHLMPGTVFGLAADQHIGEELLGQFLRRFALVAHFYILVANPVIFFARSQIEDEGAGFLLGLEMVNYGLIMCAYWILKRLQRQGKLTLATVNKVALLPTLTTAMIHNQLFSGSDHELAYYFGLAILSAVCLYAVIFWLNSTIFLALSYLLCFTVFFVPQILAHEHAIAWGMLFSVYIALLVLLVYFQAATELRYLALEYSRVQQAKYIEALYDEFQLNASDWEWQTDAAGNISAISLKAGQGSALPDLTGIRLEKLFHAEEPNTQSLANYLSQQMAFRNLLLKPGDRLDSNKIWELRGRPLYGDNETFRGFRGFARDVTDTQKLGALQHVHEKVETINHFAAKITHDMNNYLMIIQANTEFLEMSMMEKISASENEVLASIKNAIVSASNVNSELLSYTKKEILRPVKANLETLLEEAVAKYRPIFPDVEFICSIEKNLIVFVDLIAFARSIDNLLNNAVEALPGPPRGKQGKVIVSGSFMDEGSGGKVTLAVKDNGSGFTQEALRQAGQPFYTTRRHSGGSGLGLATVSGFVQQSGGRLTLANRPSGGAAVTITLPAARGNLAPVRSLAEPSSPMEGLSVLIVDDDKRILEALARQLEAANMHATTAASYDEALSIVRNSVDKFDVLLTDVHLDDDDRSGLDFASETAGKFRQVVFMTGYSHLTAQLSGRAVLPKPFSNKDFLATLRDVVSTP